MKLPVGPEAVPVARALSEREIQERLYGRYHRAAVRSEETSVSSMSAPAETEKQWTGAEILEAELQRLRLELERLHQERQRLSAALGSRPSGPKFLWKRVAISLVILTALGFFFGEKLLIATPSGREATPYTIQLVVYETRARAEQALVLLQEMDYPAFLVETTTRQGNRHFRVYIGRFVTKEEAHQARERLVADSRFSDAFVRIQ